MQKISCYLYPNKINLVADVALYPVRWKIVYQNKIKIYKGVDNILTLDVKNSDQKRISLSGMTLKMTVTDVKGALLLTTDVVNSLTTQGLATVNLTADALKGVNPQFLKFTIYRVNPDTTRTVLYADTQFGAEGLMELVGAAFPQAGSTIPEKIPSRYITRFYGITNTDMGNVLLGTTVYYSDAVEITRPNFLKAEVEEYLTMEFSFKDLVGSVIVEWTKDAVVSAGTTWETIETFNVTTMNDVVTKTYEFPTYRRDYNWARVKYQKSGTNTGSINAVIVTFDDISGELVLDGGGA
jgi:hypothetical protein